MTTTTKFIIGNEYARNGDGDNMRAIPYHYVAIARSETKITFLQVTIHGGFHFTIERDILTDCNNCEYVILSENEGRMSASNTAAIQHMNNDSKKELREYIAPAIANTNLMEQFHAKLVDYYNAEEILEMYMTQAFATGQFDESLRQEACKVSDRVEALEAEIIKMYPLAARKNCRLRSVSDHFTIKQILLYNKSYLLEVTA